MEENLIWPDYFSLLLSDFFSTFNIVPFPVIILVVEDISKAHFDSRPDHEAKFNNASKPIDFNGAIVPPKEFNDKFQILINEAYIIDSIEKKNKNWIGTLAHEATHIDDFITFAKILGVTDYDIILDESKFLMFRLWTEFNARAKGYYFLRKHLLPNVSDETLLPYILEEELPLHWKNLFEGYHSTNDGFEQMYHVVQFLGRLYVLQDLYPSQFTDEFVFEYFNPYSWMYELFIFLSSHTTLEKAYKDFDSMEKIFKTDFN